MKTKENKEKRKRKRGKEILIEARIHTYLFIEQRATFGKGEKGPDLGIGSLVGREEATPTCTSGFPTCYENLTHFFTGPLTFTGILPSLFSFSLSSHI